MLKPEELDIEKTHDLLRVVHRHKMIYGGKGKRIPHWHTLSDIEKEAVDDFMQFALMHNDDIGMVINALKSDPILSEVYDTVWSTDARPSSIAEYLCSHLALLGAIRARSRAYPPEMLAD